MILYVTSTYLIKDVVAESWDSLSIGGYLRCPFRKHHNENKQDDIEQSEVVAK